MTSRRRTNRTDRESIAARQALRSDSRWRHEADTSRTCVDLEAGGTRLQRRALPAHLARQTAGVRDCGKSDAARDNEGTAVPPLQETRRGWREPRDSAELQPGVRLISAIQLRNFRTAAQTDCEPGELTALIGPNGSGKSNVLRALDLFFNGTIEGAPLTLARDYHKPWRTTHHRTIEVEIEFHLPPSFNIPRPVRASVEALGISGGSHFALAKRWSRDPVREGSVVEAIDLQPAGADKRELSIDDARTAARFLQLIRYRYIPNHVHPYELLQAEYSALQDALIKALKSRLKRSGAAGGDIDRLLREMSQAAVDTVAPINATLTSSPGQVERIEVSTPENWEQVVWSFAMRMQSEGGRPLDVALHGSGNQSFLMYSLISYLDTRFSQQFGWHQANIWGVEVPESFFHQDLKYHLASFLVELCGQERFQGLLTTHEVLFAAAADRRYSVESGDSSTTMSELSTVELADQMVAAGVTPFVHPLNVCPPKPALMLDGPFDVFYFREAYRHLGQVSPWDIRCLETVDPGVAGSGRTQLRDYLRRNQGALRARPLHSPVVVALDWEDSEAQRAEFEHLLQCHPTSRAVVMPADLSNPDIGESFHGVERFLGTDIMRTVAQFQPGITQTVAHPQRFELQPSERATVKRALRDACRTRDNPDDVSHIGGLAKWLEAQLVASSLT
jgi:energy-coupling factor transporter ATP-binding protein EcfA2